MILICMALGQTCLAWQQNVPRDTSLVEVRQFDGSAIRSYKKQDAFQYNKVLETAPSLWSRFWSWVWWQIDQLLSTPGGKITFKTLLIIFGLAMLVFFVMKVTGMSRDGLFGRGSGSSTRYTTTTEDIHAISFDEAIAEAVASGNYRLAVRLRYLQVLKTLTDKGFIEWQVNKTNTDYVAEVSAHSWRQLFEKLTHSFEYTWYGEAAIAPEHYEALQQQFQQFNRQLQ